MKRSLLLIGVLLLTSLPPAWGQKATERFIPIGESPGLSDGRTLIGMIARVDLPSRTITVALEGEGQGISVVTERTRIWLDRSPLKLPNVRGSMADLVPGRWMEAKPVSPDRPEAEWVKIQLSEP